MFHSLSDYFKTARVAGGEGDPLCCLKYKLKGAKKVKLANTVQHFARFLSREKFRVAKCCCKDAPG